MRGHIPSHHHRSRELVVLRGPAGLITARSREITDVDEDVVSISTRTRDE
jgi:hypothetical protein